MADSSSEKKTKSKTKNKIKSEKDVWTGTSVKKEKVKPQNYFQNDGSFMDMFKTYQNWQQAQTEATTSTPDPPTESEQEDSSSKEAEVKMDAPVYTTQTMCYKDGPSSAKPQYQGIIGKRKTLLKTLELREKRKKRREELEEQQNAEFKEQKSSAWKSYMAEVKAYEDKRCGDTDDHKRPLVK